MDTNISYSYREQLKAPLQVALDITNKCNLRCLHCFNSSGENQVIDTEMTDDEVLSFIDTLVPMQLYNICFCGGEPLMRKELLLKCIKKLSVNNSTISMVTNGILATPELLDSIITTGLRNLQFSLDGATCKSHDRLRNHKGAFEHVIKAIKTASGYDNIQLSIAFTPTSFNIDEFPLVYDLLHEIQENSKLQRHIRLRVQPLMPLGRAEKNILEILPTAEQYRKLIYEIRKRRDSDLDIEWGDPVDHLIRFTHRKLSVNMCSVRANGDITVTPYIPLIVGNIKRHSLQEYWDVGLNTIWDRKIVQALASEIKSIPDMNRIFEKYPYIYSGQEIELDLFTDDLDDVSILDRYMTSK